MEAYYVLFIDTLNKLWVKRNPETAIEVYSGPGPCHSIEILAKGELVLRYQFFPDYVEIDTNKDDLRYWYDNPELVERINNYIDWFVA